MNSQLMDLLGTQVSDLRKQKRMDIGIIVTPRANAQVHYLLNDLFLQFQYPTLPTETKSNSFYLLFTNVHFKMKMALIFLLIIKIFSVHYKFKSHKQC